MSTSSTWLSVAIWPSSINFLIRSPALTPIERPRSPTVTPSVMRTTRLEAFGVVISVLRCSLPGSARRFFGTRSPRISRSAARSVLPFLTTFFFLIAPRAPGLLAASWSGVSCGPPSGCAGCCCCGAKRPVSPGRALGAPAWVRVPGDAGRGGGAFGRRSILPRTFGPFCPSSRVGPVWEPRVRLIEPRSAPSAGRTRSVR